MEKLKTWRVYFNRREDWPMVWCVDEGDISSEIRCHWVDFSGAKSAVGNTLMTGSQKCKVPENEPVAWIDVVGVPYLDKGVVRFRK
jgi:hypothetical protein